MHVIGAAQPPGPRDDLAGRPLYIAVQLIQMCFEIGIPIYWTRTGVLTWSTDAAAFTRSAYVPREALVAFRRSRAEKGVAGRFEASLGYGCQLALGYFLMLAAMTYAVELFISAITGVAIGHALFRTDRAAAPPCCAPERAGVEAPPLEASLLDGSGLA